MTSAFLAASGWVQAAPLRVVVFTRLPYGQAPHYADCFFLQTAAQVTIEQWTAAFFSSRAFRLEALLLNRLLRSKATDAAARDLAEQRTQVFSAWTLKQRAPGQLLLRSGVTRTWLATASTPSEHQQGQTHTRLFLGSAVLNAGDASLTAWALRSTLGIHRLYSRALLRSGARAPGGHS